MIAGRKLLLADDSAAIQKVIELTFADEGMEVFTVSDGRSALETLEQVAPDVVLADVFMPDVSGYDLCRSIKQNERFAGTPVMLLISSFEPFDEAEARRAGADDIVAKPFQSIRQLVSRVGSLLGGKSQTEDMSTSYSTLGLSNIERDAPAVNAPDAEAEPDVKVMVEAAPFESYDTPAPHEPFESPEESNVTVLVEAAPLEAHESDENENRGPACSTDIDLQTADTRRLEPLDRQAASEAEWQLPDTVEIEPAVTVLDEETEGASDEDEPEPAEIMSQTFEHVTTAQPVPPAETLLEIEDEYISAEALSDDVILDLDFEEVIADGRLPEPVASPAAASAAEASAIEPDTVGLPAQAEPAQTILQESAGTNLSAAPDPDHLSAEAIDAIARRVVERMSDNVVREIAWEVVPELSELLIRQKIEDPK